MIKPLLLSLISLGLVASMSGQPSFQNVSVETSVSPAKPENRQKTNQIPEIQSLTVVDTIVEQYGKFEYALELSATYDNPYDYEEVLVSALFTAPDGSQRSVDGFFMQDYDMDLGNGQLNPIGSGQFKVRFSPDQIGEWKYRVSLKDVNGTATFDEQSFQCSPPSSPNNNGFVRINTSNYLEFDNGEQLILVGENMAWENDNAFIDYRNWLTKLSLNGGNYIRLWHAHWGLGIEWKSDWEDFLGLRRYKESNCFYQDWLYDFCAENGIYVMLALQHHGPVSSQVNPNWNDSPYNAANGGPCQNTWDFFTNEEAIAHTKNRYRYILARWGYARSIQSWELFNEVNWTDNFADHQTEIQNWHTEMAGYLKTIDPYQHLVTTSFASENLDPFVWANPDIDFTQTHFYINTSNIERALAGGVRDYLEAYEKPTLTGEFGLGAFPELSNADADGIHLHNGLWGALFGGGMGTGMSWWWDMYIHPQDLYYHFAPIRTVADEIPFAAENMRPATSYVLGTRGDLSLIPNLDWGIKGDENITINENGTTDPSHPRLGQFLYGSQWNTQFRSPPTFTLSYPEAGEFTVRTGAQHGNSPKISIYLNGELVLNENAETNKTYTIPVPAGPNLIKVDNLGTDWITIASYTFTSVGSKIDAYALVAENKKLAAGWVLNHQYNHQFLKENGEPESAVGGELILEGFQEGEYFVKWYDCLTGELFQAEAVSAANDQLSLLVPELFWDMAFRVDSEVVFVKAKESLQPIALEVYPNPAKSGAELTLKSDEASLTETKLSIFDAGGRLVQSSLLQGSTHFTLAQNLPAGFYWVKLQGKGMVGTKGIVVD